MSFQPFDGKPLQGDAPAVASGATNVQEEACRKIDAREVEQDAWAFFDGAGNPLHANFVVPNSGTVWRKAGMYVLEARPEQSAPGLRDYLSRVSIYNPSSPAVPFGSIAALQAHLDRTAGA